MNTKKADKKANRRRWTNNPHGVNTRPGRRSESSSSDKMHLHVSENQGAFEYQTLWAYLLLSVEDEDKRVAATARIISWLWIRRDQLRNIQWAKRFVGYPWRIDAYSMRNVYFSHYTISVYTWKRFTKLTNIFVREKTVSDGFKTFEDKGTQ